jgi:5-methylthioadenosine/S-adenosylhomocysteine deaminase
VLASGAIWPQRWVTRRAWTLGGAHCAGLEDRIGSLTPGKQADLLMIQTDDTNLYPSNNAVGTVVQAAERSNVDTVIIGGRVRKHRGQVVDSIWCA